MAKKFGRFLLVGGLCTAIQYGILIVLVEVAGMQPTPASTLGYLLSSFVNYVLNYFFTFRSAAQHQRSLPRFVVIMLCGLVLNAAVTYGGVEIVGVHYYLLAQVAATLVTLLWNFWANLRWTF